MHITVSQMKQLLTIIYSLVKRSILHMTALIHYSHVIWHLYEWLVANGEDQNTSVCHWISGSFTWVLSKLLNRAPKEQTILDSGSSTNFRKHQCFCLYTVQIIQLSWGTMTTKGSLLSDEHRFCASDSLLRWRAVAPSYKLMVHWLTDWLNDSLTHSLTHLLTNSLTDSLTDWLLEWLNDWL